MSSSISSLRRIGIGALLFAGMSLQALAQTTNRLEGITFTTGAGNKVELTLRLSDNAPTPLTFTVDNPARIALDLPETTVAMSSRRVDVKQGVVDTVNVAEANGRTRVVLNVDNLVPYETRVSGNTIIVSVGGGSRAASNGSAVSTAAAVASQTPRSAAPISGSRSVNNIDFRRGADGSGRVVVELTDAKVPADLRQEGGTVEPRAVGVDVHEVLGEVLVEPFDVGLVDRAHVVVVQLVQGGEMR